MNIQPLHDRIVVEAAARESKSAGGIILPDSAQEKPLSGKVLAVGPGKTLDSGTTVKPEVKKGDTVLYGKYAGTEVKVGGKDYVILRTDDVLGIVVSSAVASITGSAKGKATATGKPTGKVKAKNKGKAKAGAR
jgi:chaperonin GroES